jgi:uncharacterized membrane protein HdeD (DUF308 family)
MSTTLDDRFLSTFSRNWWAIAVRGVLAIVLAIAAFFLPGLTLASLVLLLAAYFILDGIFALVAGFRAASRDERWWPFLVEGAIDLAAGAVAVIWPAITVLALVVLLGAWSILTGLVIVYGAVRGYRGRGRWLLAANGVLSVLLGVAILLFPAAGALTIAWLVGFYALLFGVGMVILAYRLRRLESP